MEESRKIHIEILYDRTASAPFVVFDYVVTKVTKAAFAMKVAEDVEGAINYFFNRQYINTGHEYVLLSDFPHWTPMEPYLDLHWSFYCSLITEEETHNVSFEIKLLVNAHLWCKKHSEGAWYFGGLKNNVYTIVFEKETDLILFKLLY